MTRLTFYFGLLVDTADFEEKDDFIENAIDAGAGRVAVQVEGGGTSLIRVIDDGAGMDQDDILLSLERHATSKLSRVEQLDDIRTLGFRGEAVPSIASVARLTITSRQPDAQLGSRVEVRFGKVMKVHEMGGQTGTVVEVRDLFGNVPARKKFLKTTRTELSHIEEAVRNYALAKPGLAVSYSVNGREIFSLAAADGAGARSGCATGAGARRAGRGPRRHCLAVDASPPSGPVGCQNRSAPKSLSFSVPALGQSTSDDSPLADEDSVSY